MQATSGSGPGAATRAASERIRTRVVAHRDFTPALLDSLYALANRLMAEDVAHFRLHAETNDVVHVFERPGGEPVGFQFWRSAAMDQPHHRALFGGKLRIDPAYRRRALHLRSGLRFYLDLQLRHPRTRFYRMSLASMFGFVSITSALAEYRLFDVAAVDPEARVVRSSFERLAAQSHYELDPATSLFNVGIRPTEQTLAEYSASYYARPAAQVYVRANPAWRTNGCFVGFWFRFTPANLWSLTRAIVRKR